MENPASHGKAEKVIEKAIADFTLDVNRKVAGVSLQKRIANALKEAKLLKEDAIKPEDHIDTHPMGRPWQ